jgi:flavin-dependent dehydrogenase
VAGREVLAEARLPATALSLTRRTLDEALLARARQAGVSLLRGYAVESLAYRGDAINAWQARIVSASTQTSMYIHGRDAFLATGKHDLRGWPRATRGAQNTLVAMKMYFALSPEQQAQLDGHVELILFPGGYAGLQPVEAGWANLSALVTQQKLRSLGGRWSGLLDHMQHSSRHLARRLTGAMSILERPLALSAIPYGYCAEVSVDEASPWRLGDQAAVIPSFCGDGMAIALHTAHRGAQLYFDGSSPAAFHAEIRCQFERRLSFATMLSRLAIAMPPLAQVVRLWPSAMSAIFTATRVPDASILAAKL